MRTKHNSASMKTQVETFFIEETVDLIYDNEKLAQWNKQVEALGLDGQKKVSTIDKSPVPFLWMNEVTKAVFEELCPRKTDIADYDKTPIPVEALELVALSQKENYFYKMEVWYNDKAADPCIVGYRDVRGETGFNKEWYAERYLLARWSDVKASLAQLTAKAKQLFILRTKNELEHRLKRTQRDLEDLELTANDKFGIEGENASPDSFDLHS